MDIERAHVAFGEMAKVNGTNYQTTVAIEEFSELIKELTKHLRGKGSKMKLTEELADAAIMLEQVRMLYDISTDDVEVFYEHKVRRLEQFYINTGEAK